MDKRLIYLFLLYILFTINVSAEIINLGVPSIHNYPKKEYKAGTQNWSITQDQKGFMYFGNNEGLLQFDGVNWQLFRMSNSSIVRSIFIDQTDQIYVGAYNDLGKMEIGTNGQMKYKSLKQFIPKEFHNFDDIWNISRFESQIVFQSYNCAFFFRNDSTVKIVKAPSKFQKSFQTNNRLFFNDIENGLLEYENQKLASLRDCEKIRGEEIWSILPVKGGKDLMICTLDKGIFIYNGTDLKEWKCPLNTQLKEKQIFSASIIQDKYFAIGTIQDGVIICDENGNIIQHINRQKGLQNNTVLQTFTDRTGNLWLGLDNGIDYLNINSPITFLQQDGSIGAGYTSIIYNNKLYLGTNQGLFVKEWNESRQSDDYRLITGTNGQVWYLGIHDGVLLCGHNNGAFIIEGEKAQQISKIPGAWKFYASKRFPDYLIGGTYSGLICLKKQNKSWVFSGKIAGFDESCRIFEEDDNGDLWMSHGFKGIYKITFGKSIDTIDSWRFFTTKDGLPTNYNLNVYKIKGKVIVTSNNGIYEYNQKTDKFEPSGYFNQLLKPLKDISFLKEDQEGNIWYMIWILGKKTTGVFRIQEDQSYKQVSAPFGLLTGRFISGFESINLATRNHIFFGTEEGFAHYSLLSDFRNNTEFKTFITKATALHLDSVFFYGETSYSARELPQKTNGFTYKDNGFRFSYTSPTFENQENIEYSFSLSGTSDKWSDWSSTSFTEYSNLPSGDHIFKVKARNQLGIESTTAELNFTINPPWYATYYAYAVYLILFLGLVFLSIWAILKRIEISKRKERLKHLKAYRQKEQEFIRQSLISEKKIINLKNEKLRIEMKHRDKELANQTMDLIRKNKFLVKIKEELEKLRNSSSDDSLKDKITSLIAKIDKDIDHKKQWEIFESAFDEVHEDFLSRLKMQYPNLTPKELRLCAYLRMNISTKEIAPLMNISVRGVEICRYRVRKKLNIDRDQNLTGMILNL